MLKQISNMFQKSEAWLLLKRYFLEHTKIQEAYKALAVISVHQTSSLMRPSFFYYSPQFVRWINLWLSFCLLHKESSSIFAFLRASWFVRYLGSCLLVHYLKTLLNVSRNCYLLINQSIRKKSISKTVKVRTRFYPVVPAVIPI